MMKSGFFTAILAILLLSNVFYQTRAVAQDGPSEWSSAPCSSLAIGPGDEISHLQRIFLLGKLDYTIQYKYFSDPQCKLPLYSLIFKGTSDTTGVSKTIADTLDVTVNLDRVLFTLDSPRGAKAAVACGDGKFEVGVQRDVTSSGCLHIKPKSVCGYDYEIVKIKDGVAIPGFRNADMCTLQGRPTKLQSLGATFVEQF
jgi:hypothetical protein